MLLTQCEVIAGRASHMIRRYSELVMLPTFEERYNYLRLKGSVGEDTFGFERYLNQSFYKSAEWRSVRDRVIVRDDACDLGIPGRQIYKNVIVHHLNPITKYDLDYMTEYLLNPEYLICVSHRTHNAIHYGDDSLLIKDPVPRSANDTCPWKIRKEV